MKFPCCPALTLFCAFSLWLAALQSGEAADERILTHRTGRPPEVRVDSEETAGSNGKGANAVDGDPATIWATQWQEASPAHPHEIVLQLRPAREIEGLSYLPRQDGSEDGWIKDYAIYVSDDGRHFGEPVRKGSFAWGEEKKVVMFDTVRCGFVKLVALNAFNGGTLTTAAEIEVLAEGTAAALTAAVEAVVPMDQRPFKVPTNPATRRRLVQQIRDYLVLPPAQVRAHPSATDYPGVAPADSARITKEVTVAVPTAGTSNRWISTGLYANAGEVVTVSPMQPPNRVFFEIRIGCHVDEKISNYDPEWLRFPVLSRSFSVTEPETPVASAFGGQIFVQVDNWSEDPAVAGMKLKVRIANAVQAPYFVLGETTRKQWKTLREAPAPWGELAGNGVIFHFPSAMLRGMDDPSKLMEWWNNAVDLEDELVAWPTRTVPERIVFERQMSGNWGHSGYPIMMDAAAAEGALDLASLRKDGDWGIFHEIGHNHQSNDWTFTENPLLEQTEVTVNFFSLWCMEKLVAKPLGTGHPAIEGRELFARLDERFGATPSNDAFEQLAPIVVLIQQYGSEPLHKTLASYQTSPIAKDLPEAERQAEFVRRYSLNANADLSHFFKKSGFTVPQKLSRELKSLPAFNYATWRKEAEARTP